MSDTSPRSGRRLLRVAATLIAVAAVVRFAFGVDAPSDVLLLPSAGSVRAALLSDGTPVFLAHPSQGTAQVVEAVVTQGVGPIGAVAGWCPAVQQFVAPHHGLRWDAVGEPLPATTPGRLPEMAGVTGEQGGGVGSAAVPALVRRGFQRLDGRGDAEDPLLVEGPLPADAPPGDLPLAGSRAFSPPTTCRVVPTPLPLPGDIGPAIGHIPHLLDHAFLARLLRLPRERWQITNGYLLVDSDASLTWCRVPPVGMPPMCPDAAPVPLSVTVSVEQVGGGYAVIGGPLAARVVEGTVVAVAALPSSLWRGSSLQGSFSYAAERALLHAEGSRVLLHPRAAEDTAGCLRRPPMRPGPQVDVPLEQAVDADTMLVADGLVDPEAAVTLLDGSASVEVVVDTATCRALRIDISRP